MEISASRDHPVYAIPLLADNYAYAMMTGPQTCLVIDPGEAEPVRRWLTAQSMRLNAIVITHHHGDHTGGIAELVDDHKTLPVYGPDHPHERIMGLTHPVQGGDILTFGENALSLKVMALPGHTLSHVGYYAQEAPVLFAGDCLFPLGCGRTLTGDYAAHFQSLAKINSLPDTTLLCTGHEYTLANARFAQGCGMNAPSLADYIKRLVDQQARAQTTHPIFLKDEKRCNPFLIAKTAEEFARLRRAKDRL